MNFIPMNEVVLVKVNKEETENNTNQIYIPTSKPKFKVGEIVAFSEKCENKNLENGVKVYISTNYELTEFNKDENLYLIVEKAILGIEK